MSLVRQLLDVTDAKSVSFWLKRLQAGIFQQGIAPGSDPDNMVVQMSWLQQQWGLGGGFGNNFGPVAGPLGAITTTAELRCISLMTERTAQELEAVNDKLDRVCALLTEVVRATGRDASGV